MRQKMPKNTSESGNVLFIILIAVALFAALSYAVTSSSRSGGGNISKEKIALEIGQIEQFISSVRQEIMRIKIIGGYDYYNIDYSGFYSQPARNNFCTNNGCRLFSTNGGNLTPRSDLSLATYWFGNISVQDVGSDLKDFIMLGTLTEEICTAINDKYGIDHPGGNPPYDSWNWWYGGGFQRYGGNLASEVDLSGPPTLGEDNVPSIAGKDIFCTLDGWNNYRLVVVLGER